jgi:hypothetical protein
MSDDAPPPNAWANMPREFWQIAFVVLAIFLVVVTLILLGCWALLSGRVSPESGAGLAAVAGLVGAIAGYAASNTQTVLSTIFGGNLPGQHPQRTVNASGSTTINEAAAVELPNQPTKD